METILQVKNLTTQFESPNGIIKAVNGINYSLKKGETIGIVGESGCGKSVSVMSLLRLIPTPPGKIIDGEVLFNNQDLLKISEKEIQKVRGNQISMIFQDPMTSLNPIVKIGRQISEVLEIHNNISSGEARSKAIELLELVGVPSAKNRIDAYPIEFSGGMRQRVMIAMGLACNPKILIADEPTTALDVTIQAQIIATVNKLQNEFGMSVIWITHDLGVVAGIADRVIVMYAGTIVEEAPVVELYTNPRHPYTIGLLQSVPRLHKDRPEKLFSISGMPPDLVNYPQGCPFYERCIHRKDKCLSEKPSIRNVTDTHTTACFFDIEMENKIEDSQLEALNV